MDPRQTSDLRTSFEQSRSGLRDSHRRSLMGILFMVTASSLFLFGTLQFLNDNPLFAAGEYLAGAFLFWGKQRLRTTPYLHRWIYAYLISGFAFALVILVMPKVSITAFAWILMIPVLAYLLLGRTEGLRLSVPFLLGGCAIYAFTLGDLSNAMAVIDLLNLILCAALMLCFIHIYETRREEAEKKLFELAQKDSLTGVANRASFQGVLNRTIAECRRSGSGFALVIMDVDHFKLVNDTMGHDAGDHALSRIGELLTERLRTTDFVGRLGGEEFGLILRDVKPDDSYELMEDLRQRIASTGVPYGEATIKLTASFGIAHFPDHARDPETLYRVADRCLFAGKRAGRNTVARAGVAVAK